MADLLKVLTVGLVLSAATVVPHARAQTTGVGRTLLRAQNPVKPETCKPRWPYVVQTCVA